MNTRADKPRNNKTQAVAKEFPRKRGRDSAFQFVDNRTETVAQRKMHMMADNSPQVKKQKAIQDKANGINDKKITGSRSNAPIQGNFVFDDGTVVNQVDQFQNEGVTFDNLDAQIQSPLTWLVHDQSDLEWLDADTKVDVLTPHRHVIGESHNASNFNAMKAKWPQAAVMEEGATHTVEESNLQLPANPAAAGHNVFNTIAHVTNQAVEPLENFHAANMVRVALFLTQWNEQHETHPAPFSWLNNPVRKRLIPETASIVNQYVSLAVGVYMRGIENRKWWQIMPRFGTAVEEEYNNLYRIAKGDRARRALDLLNGFRNNINADISPTPTQNEYDDVKWYVMQLLTPIKDILVTSVGLGSGDQAAIQGATNFGTYLDQNAATMRDAQVGAVLASGNVPRETFMARHIGGLARPGLVKTGFAHIAGLQALNIANTAYYNDWQTFIAATQKDQSGL